MTNLLNYELESPSNPKKLHLLVVVCTKCREKFLRYCINSLIKEIQSVPTYTVRVLVVGSRFEKDGFLRLMTEYEQKLRNIFQFTLQDGTGLPNARNSVFPVGQADIVLFLDDDVVLEPGYLRALIYHFEKDSTLGGLSGTYQKIPRMVRNIPQLLSRIKSILDSTLIGGDLDSDIGEVWKTGISSVNFDIADRPRQVKRLSGCNMAYRREAMKAVDRFDEEYGSGTAMGEDCDYSFRIFRRGYRLLLDPSMKVYHKDVDESVFPQSKDFFIELGKNNTRIYLKFFYDGHLSNFFVFVLSHLYLSVIYEFAGLMRKSPFRGVNYLKGVLTGLAKWRKIYNNTHVSKIV